MNKLFSQIFIDGLPCASTVLGFGISEPNIKIRTLMEPTFKWWERDI